MRLKNAPIHPLSFIIFARKVALQRSVELLAVLHVRQVEPAAGKQPPAPFF